MVMYAQDIVEAVHLTFEIYSCAVIKKNSKSVLNCKLLSVGRRRSLVACTLRCVCRW